MKKIIELSVNGESAEFLVEPRETLLEVLRDRMGLIVIGTAILLAKIPT